MPDTDVSTLDRRPSADFRGKHIGLIFQDFNLIPVFTPYENIDLRCGMHFKQSEALLLVPAGSRSAARNGAIRAYSACRAVDISARRAKTPSATS